MVRKLDGKDLSVSELAMETPVIKYAVKSDEKLLNSELKHLIQKNKVNKMVSFSNQSFTLKARIKSVQEEGEGAVFEVEEESTLEEFYAIKATSCLLVPMENDLVLVQGFADGTAYILEILESSKDNALPTTVSFPDKAILESKSLIVNVSNFKTKANKYEIEAVSYSLNALSHSSVTVNYDIKAVNLELNSKKLETVAESSVASFISSVRFISDTEKVRALNLNYSAESLAKYSGKVMMLNGFDLLKSDGKLMMVG